MAKTRFEASKEYWAERYRGQASLCYKAALDLEGMRVREYLRVRSQDVTPEVRAFIKEMWLELYPLEKPE